MDLLNSFLISLFIFIIFIFVELKLNKGTFVNITLNLIALLLSTIVIYFIIVGYNFHNLSNYQYFHTVVLKKYIEEYSTMESEQIECGTDSDGETEYCTRYYNLYHKDFHVKLLTGDDITTSTNNSELKSYVSRTRPDRIWKETYKGEPAVSTKRFKDYVLATAGYNTYLTDSDVKELDRKLHYDYFRIDIIKSNWLDSYEKEYQLRLNQTNKSFRIYEHSKRYGIEALLNAYPIAKPNEVIFHIVVNDDKLIEVIPITYAKNGENYLHSLVNMNIVGTTTETFYRNVIYKALSMFTVSDPKNYEFLNDLKVIPAWLIMLRIVVAIIISAIGLFDNKLNRRY